MLVPPSFGLAYWPEEANAHELQRYAGDRLRVLCSGRRWLFADRVKSEESALAKLELGPVRSLAEMQDMYAATVVVPTRAEVESAVTALEAAFPHVERVRRRQGRAQEFVYNDVHVLARLGSAAPGLAEGLRSRVFEIQVRTGLQYAWWRATHDAIYKGGERTWRLQRVASQVRASLELLDGVLGDLRTAATLLDEPLTDEDKAFDEVAGWLDRWPKERQPADVTRFFTVACELAAAVGSTPSQLGQVLDTDMGKALLVQTEITPFQALLGAAVTEHGVAIVDSLRKPRYVLVTDELRRSCVATDGIPNRRRARL